MNMFLHSKRDSADVTTRRALGWGNYPGLSGWVQCDDKGPYKREAGRSEKRRDWMTEAEVREREI